MRGEGLRPATRRWTVRKSEIMNAVMSALEAHTLIEHGPSDQLTEGLPAPGLDMPGPESKLISSQTFKTSSSKPSSFIYPSAPDGRPVHMAFSRSDSPLVVAAGRQPSSCAEPA